MTRHLGMSTSIHIPEGLLAFHIGHTGDDSQLVSRRNPITIVLKRVVADLQKWLHCRWAVGMIPGGRELVPELNVVCVSGDAGSPEVPDMICPIRGDRDTGVAAVVAIGPKSDGTPYSDDDRHLADALCEHMGGVLNNERLAHNISEDLMTYEQAEEDVATARGIYDRLDHRHLRRIPGLEYGAQCQRADRLSGDFFDLLPHGDRDLVVAIGNVAARGLPAGIMLGGALASVRALVSRGESLVQIAAELNRTQWDLSPEDSFTSFLCARIDPSRKLLRYVSAGHEPALLIRGRTGQVDRLDPTGTVLGLSRRSAYRENFVSFEPGDLMAAFTDGIAESSGADGVVRILRERSSDTGLQELAVNVVETAESAVDRTIVLVRSSDAESLPLPVERCALAAA